MSLWEIEEEGRRLDAQRDKREREKRLNVLRGQRDWERIQENGVWGYEYRKGVTNESNN